METHQPILRLGPADHGRPVTADEFATAEFDEPWTYEREGGRLVVMSPEGQEHVNTTRPWLKTLVLYWAEHPEVVDDVVPQPWIRPDGDTDRIGDLGVYLVVDGPALSIPDRVPDLVFEIVSPGRQARERDYVKKKADYYRLGVREYIVVDRFDRTVTAFTRGARQYRGRVLGVSQVYTSPLLPGLEIPLAGVF